MTETIVLVMQAVVTIGLMPVYRWMFVTNRFVGEMSRDVRTLQRAVNGETGIPARCEVHSTKLADIRKDVDYLKQQAAVTTSRKAR